MSKSQPVYDIIDKIDMPSGDDVFFPMILPGIEFPGKFRSVYYMNKSLVGMLDHRQSVLLGQEISREVGERYTLLPLQVSCLKISTDTNFRKMVDRLGEKTAYPGYCGYRIWNREVLFDNETIMPDPTVRDVEGELVYEGETVHTKLDKDNVFNTLKAASICEVFGVKTSADKIHFKDGISAVTSNCGHGDGPRVPFVYACGFPPDVIDYARPIAFMKPSDMIWNRYQFVEKVFSDDVMKKWQ